MRRLSEAQPSLAEAGWGGARRSARIAGGDTPEGIRTALFSNPTFCERAAPTARNAQASWIGALTSARGRSRATPIQLRLSSLRSLRLRILPPQGGKGNIESSPRLLSARFGLGVVDLDGEAAVLDRLFLLGHLGDDL